MEKQIPQQLKDLQEINKQRKYWLVLSAFVVAVVSYIIFDWNKIENHHIAWTVGSLGLIVSVIWWYWTMRIIRLLINHRIEETKILQEMAETILEIRNSIRK